MRGDFLPEAHNKTRRVVEGQTWATYVGVGHFDVLANDTSQAGKKKRKERRMLKAVERWSWLERGCNEKIVRRGGF
jgi:hypothetical protein